jgi:hypothetical protein
VLAGADGHLAPQQKAIRDGSRAATTDRCRVLISK